MTSFQVKVLQKKFTLLHAHISKIVLKYSNEVHLLRYLTPLVKSKSLVLDFSKLRFSLRNSSCYTFPFNFSFSAISPYSGMNHDSTAFVGCDQDKVKRPNYHINYTIGLL